MKGFVLAALLILMSATARAEPPEPVESGKEGLRRGGFNWYDRATDELRRVDVKPPDPPAAPNVNFNPAPIGQLFYQIVMWLIIGVPIARLAYFLIVTFLNRESGVASDDATVVEAASEVDRTDALPVAINKNISDLLAEARRAYEAGNYREAIIYLYSHELLILDKRQVIHLAKGKTNRQYLREIARSGRRGLESLLEQTLVTFEDVFFGSYPLDRARFESCWARLPEFDRLIEEGTS